MLDQTQKKYLLIFLVLAGVIVLYFVFGKNLKVKIPGSEKPINETQVEYLDSDKLPPNLPENLPLEANAPLLRNEIVRLPNKENQFVRNYYSQKTVAENFAIYEKYLQDNGWKINFNSLQESFGTLLASKPDRQGVLQIKVSKNTITKDVTVEIIVIVKQ